MRAPVPPPLRNWRRDPREAKRDDLFIARVLELWDQGRDTADIALTTFESEATVAAALRIGRERRLAK